MDIHLFGRTSSPSCASFILHKYVQDHDGEFSHDVVDSVMKNLFVDDCLKSVVSSRAARALRKELCDMLSRGGFRFTKWLCNDKRLLFWIVSQG